MNFKARPKGLVSKVTWWSSEGRNLATGYAHTLLGMWRWSICLGVGASSVPHVVHGKVKVDFIHGLVFVVAAVLAVVAVAVCRRVGGGRQPRDPLNSSLFKELGAGGVELSPAALEVVGIALVWVPPAE